MKITIVTKFDLNLDIDRIEEAKELKTLNELIEGGFVKFDKMNYLSVIDDNRRKIRGYEDAESEIIEQISSAFSGRKA